MRLAYVTTYDAHDVDNWSGLGYFVARALAEQGIDISYIGPLSYHRSLLLKVKYKAYRRLLRRACLPEREIFLADTYAQQVRQALDKISPEVVFSLGTTPIARLKCEQPIVIYADATFAGLLSLYYKEPIAKSYIRKGHALERAALDRCDLAIYASEWAANSAIDFYGLNPKKIRIVPFGANFHGGQNEADIIAAIESKSRDVCKLLFIGADWTRKGGEIAVKVADEMNRKGIRTELAIAGCHPPREIENLEYVHVVGFVSKSNVNGLSKLRQLYNENHFLLVPTRADCFGVVFSEASSFGVPSVSCAVGGVPTAIKNGRNGQVFSVSAEVNEYADYISSIWKDYCVYKRLARTAFSEYQQRLNWNVSGREIKRHIGLLL